MVPASEYLKLVTLIVNSNLLNNLTGYHPDYVRSSLYYYKNENGTNPNPNPVHFNPIFTSSTFFPKCCPPGFSYDVDKKNCKYSKDITPIYEDLKIKLNLIRIGLPECQVVVDRFVEKRGLMRASTKDLKINLKVERNRYGNEKYCLDKTVRSNAYVVQLCADREYCSGSREWCVNKCCWDRHSYKGRSCKFSADNGILQDDEYQGYYEREDNYGFLYGLTDCPKQYVHRLKKLDFKIGGHGSLVRKNDGRIYDLGEYCLDSVTFTDSEESREDIVVLCEHQKRVNVRFTVVMILVVIIFASFVTAFLKSFLIYELNGLIVKLVACYTFVESIFWITIALEMVPVKFDHFCFVFGCVHVLLSVMRLSWLNVLEYEIWKTIGDKDTYTFKSKTSTCLKLLWYSLYAITIGAITMIIFILSHKRMYFLPSFVIPQINLFTCVLQLDNYGAIHLLIPVVILIIVNFMLLAKILCCCPPDNKKDVYLISQSSIEQDAFVISNRGALIVLKLAVINILTWIYYMGAFSRIFDKEITLDNVGGKTPPPYL